MYKTLKNAFVVVMALCTLFVVIQNHNGNMIRTHAILLLFCIGLYTVCEMIRLSNTYYLWAHRTLQAFMCDGHEFYFGLPEAFVTNNKVLTQVPERVTGVSVRHAKSGLIYVAFAPLRHHHVICVIDERTNDGPKVSRHDQGFITNHGRIVSRKEAYSIVVANGQISRLTPRSGELYSEDLWNSITPL